MKTICSILAGAMLSAFAIGAQAEPVSLTQSIGGGNITSSGSIFTHTLTLPEASADALDQALLSLSFEVSSNAAAQNDTISLFLGGALQASGVAASFSVINRDVSDFFDFTTGVLTFELFRDVSTGGGNIKLANSALTVAATSAGGNDPADGREQIVQQQVPEPGTLALLGIGLLGMAALRRRTV